VDSNEDVTRERTKRPLLLEEREKSPGASSQGERHSPSASELLGPIVSQPLLLKEVLDLLSQSGFVERGMLKPISQKIKRGKRMLGRNGHSKNHSVHMLLHDRLTAEGAPRVEKLKARARRCPPKEQPRDEPSDTRRLRHAPPPSPRRQD
jgi:hypothetical protein